MSIRQFSAAMVATMGLAAGGALAHETELHHWYEHQRALSDGGDMLIASPSPAKSLGNGDRGNGDRGAAAMPARKRGTVAATPDCPNEQLQMAEGYVPSGKCVTGFGEREPGYSGQ